MKEALIFILKNIVDHPEDLSVDETTQDDRIILTIHAASSDLGKIIGRQGRIISAIRDLIKLIATKRQAYVEVVLAEDAGNA